MILSMISRIIKTEVCGICRSRRLRQIIQTRGFDNSWYHAKTEFCFWGEHSKGLGNQADVEFDMINARSAADIAVIMSSLQAIVNWLNALDQSDDS